MLKPIGLLLGTLMAFSAHASEYWVVSPVKKYGAAAEPPPSVQLKEVLVGGGTVSLPTTGVGQSSNTTISFTNEGTATAVLNFGTLHQDLSIYPSCTNTLASNESCLIDVSWMPSASGPFSSSWVISSANSAITFSFSGVSQAPAHVVASEPQSFNTVTVGQSATLTWTLSNIGQASASLAFPALPAGLVKSGTCGAALAGESSCTVILTWTPSAAATLNLTYNMGATSFQVTGTAAAADATFTGSKYTAGWSGEESYDYSDGYYSNAEVPGVGTLAKVYVNEYMYVWWSGSTANEKYTYKLVVDFDSVSSAQPISFTLNGMTFNLPAPSNKQSSISLTGGQYLALWNAFIETLPVTIKAR